MQEEDVPPEHLWADTKGLEMWFESVRDRQGSGASSRSSNSGDGDDHQGDGMAENDIARSLKR